MANTTSHDVNPRVGLKKQRVIAAMMAVAFWGPFVWFVMDRTPPYAVMGGEVTPNNAAPGTTITITWVIKPLRSCQGTPVHGTITREIVDAKGVKHDYSPVLAQYNGGDTELVRHVELPVTMPLGSAKYHSVACYVCNPFHEIWPVCIRTPDIAFEVVGEAPQSAQDINK